MQFSRRIMLNRLVVPGSLTQAIQEVAQPRHTLILLSCHYIQQNKEPNTFVDYYALKMLLTGGSPSSNACLITSAKYARREDHRSFLTALEKDQWTIKVAPDNSPHEHMMIRRVLSRGMGSTYDSIVLISEASKVPELDQLRASGKHIVRCVFAQDVTDRMHQNADEVITIEELGVLY